MIRTAGEVEVILAQSGDLLDRSGEALDLLEIRASGAEQPPAAALAVYCSAAGELMRVGAQGSQYQAQSYLLTAFRAAQKAGAQDVEARAAYRLGMVSQAAPAVSGARGAGRKTRSSSVRQVAAETHRLSNRPRSTLKPARGW
jgi:hypothetical protein